jgi:cytochrome d ubiquinol oxidase subunit I
LIAAADRRKLGRVPFERRDAPGTTGVMTDPSLAEVLARIQFAFTISFHIIFPAFTIGLASYLAVLEGLWLWTKRDVYLRLFKYWMKIFAIAFAMGVVSGVVMSYQIGTNWSVFADKIGPAIGPLLGYEVLTAFFLEAGFLGVMLFGMNRVGKALHFTATLAVALGTLISAFWILAANSFMHTPAGYEINADGQLVAADWIALIFNPSFPFRFVHMTLAAYVTTAFVVGATGAFHLLKDRGDEAARTMFSMAMWMAAIAAPAQILAGDMHGLNTLEHQPAKIAAMEGHFEAETGAPFYVVGWPDMEAERTRFALAIPKAGSLILTHDPDGLVPGLKDWPADERPNATLIFWTFRIMVGIGTLMALMGITGLVLRWRGRLYDTVWLLRAAIVMGPSGFVAVLAGWITTEVGRQPWTVHGVLRTSESLAPVGAPGVAASLAAFVVVYAIVFGAGVLYLLRLMRTPVRVDEPARASETPIRSAGVTPAPSVQTSKSRS